MALERIRETHPERLTGIAQHAIVARVTRRVLGGQVRAAAWASAEGQITALLHKDDLIGIRPGDSALFFSGTAPAVAIDAHLLAESPLPEDASTCKVRFRLDPSAGSTVYSHGATDVGLLQIRPRPRDLLTVPASAVLYSDDGPYVLVTSQDGDQFTKQPVEIGRILDSSYAAGVMGDSVGAIVVLSGLREGEQVIADNAFFWEAERRLRIARGEGREVTRD